MDKNTKKSIKKLKIQIKKKNQNIKQTQKKQIKTQKTIKKIKKKHSGKHNSIWMEGQDPTNSYYHKGSKPLL